MDELKLILINSSPVVFKKSKTYFPLNAMVMSFPERLIVMDSLTFPISDLDETVRLFSEISNLIILYLSFLATTDALSTLDKSASLFIVAVELNPVGKM